MFEGVVGIAAAAIGEWGSNTVALCVPGVPERPMPWVDGRWERFMRVRLGRALENVFASSVRGFSQDKMREKIMGNGRNKVKHTFN